MGHAIPKQQPAVVLRSQFNKLRALLAIALVAVVGLTIAVVMLASEGDEVASTSVAKPIESINYGDSNRVNPSTGFPMTEIRPNEGSGSAVKDYSMNGATGDFAQGPLPSDPPPAKDYSKNSATGDF
jgi:hypothetical protein